MTLRRRAAAALAGFAVAAVAAVTTGCSPTSQITGGSVTGCFRSLPPAEAALHGKGRLLGVHRLSADALPARVRAVVPPEDDTLVCAVAFRGHFAPGQVSGAQPSAAGDFAVVLVDVRHLTVVGSFVGSRLPRSLGRRLLR